MGKERSVRARLSVQVGCIALVFGAMGCAESETPGPIAPASQVAEHAVNVVENKAWERFGLPWGDGAWAHIDSGQVQPGQSLSHLLGPHGIGASTIYALADASKPVYDVRNIRSGRPWWIGYADDTTAAWFVYERNPREFAVFNLQDSLGVRLGQYPTETRTQRVTGVIDNSLYVDLEEAGAPSTLALSMANVYAWTVDFSRLQDGDAFDVLYEREYVNQEPVGLPRVIACHFSHRGRDIPAYRFDQGNGEDYFDANGGSLRKAFLKAPVEFSRISSRYNLKRFHPVLGRTKAHLGTDYAAPHGTPIIAVGDGVVTKSGYTSGNGNYVKIRHNNTYETQYLHMSRRAVKAGESVRQGQTIGYVGATGLATGPHVCFRFWKNGQQVDHLREEFPPSEPIAEAVRPDFEALKSQLETELAKK